MYIYIYGYVDIEKYIRTVKHTAVHHTLVLASEGPRAMLLVVMFGKIRPGQGGFLPRWPSMAQLLWPHLSIEVRVALGSGETQQHHGSVLATWHSAEMVLDMNIHKHIALGCVFSVKKCIIDSFVRTFNCLVCCLQKVENE